MKSAQVWPPGNPRQTFFRVSSKNRIGDRARPDPPPQIYIDCPELFATAKKSNESRHGAKLDRFSKYFRSLSLNFVSRRKFQVVCAQRSDSIFSKPHWVEQASRELSSGSSCGLKDPPLQCLTSSLLWALGRSLRYPCRTCAAPIFWPLSKVDMNMKFG